MRKTRKGAKLNETPVPRYFQLQMDLLRGIEGGKWAPGEAIPPERKIAEQFGVSLGTVNRAIMNLVSEGYLYRLQGKGTFVSGTDIPLSSVRYNRFRSDFKSVDLAFKIKLLDIQIVEGQEQINRYLRLRKNQRLFLLKRVFLTKYGPSNYNISYLPFRMFSGLDELPLAHMEKITLYETIEKKYGLPTIFNQEMFGVALADEETAAALEVPLGKPLLKIRMISFTYKDKPYEYRISYLNVDEREIFREL
ncbi:MAG: GntR family transcriptional regulator [Desulfarculaceae bacterium]|jgi:GntR family transcriptional regulator